MEAIRVVALFTKQNSGRPVQRRSSLQLHKGLGIDGDIHAIAISPRQVLITRQEDLDDLGIAPGGLRENIVISSSSENAFQPGALLTINEAEIRLCFYCEACKRIADVAPDLSAVYHKRGILGIVQHSGVVHTGDAGYIAARMFPAFPEEPAARFRMFMERVPYGKTVSYDMVLAGMGVAAGYIRALPQYLKSTDRNRYPLHRIVDSKKALIEKYIPDQRMRLAQEGVIASGDGIVPDNFLWHQASWFV